MNIKKTMLSAFTIGALTGSPLIADANTEESVIVPVVAEEIDQNEKKQEYTREEIAEMINNPLSFLWLMGMQNDTWFMDGDLSGADELAVNRFIVMPIMPMQLTEEYKLVLRPWVPIMSTKIPRGPQDFTWDGTGGINPPPGNLGIANTSWDSGLGDLGFWATLASNEGAAPPFVWGLGITAMFDTASEDHFGLGKNSAGPMGMAFHITEKWILGTIVQHWWDYSGDKDRDGVNLTDLQYVIRYRLTDETNIGMSPNVSYDWRDDQLTLPVGGGMDTMIQLGPLPVKVGVEAYYNIKHGPEDIAYNKWQFRVFAVPVLPSPGWARTPLF